MKKIKIINIVILPLKLYLKKYPNAEIVVRENGYSINKRDLNKESKAKSDIKEIKRILGRSK